MADGRHDAVIIGAGIAGLAAAWELRDRDIVVLESEDRVGGRMRSESRDPYWLNVGAHLFGGPETVLGTLVREAELETIPIPGNIMGLAANGKILTSGKPETYPLRLPLSIPARISFIRTGLKLKSAAKKYIKANPLGSGPTTAGTRKRRLQFDGDRSFADFMGKMHPDIHEIMQATTARITATMEQVSAGGGISLFAYVWSVGGKSLLARNLAGGSGMLPKTLQQKLGERVVTGAAVTSVAQTADGVTVKYTLAGREHEAAGRFAVVATPAHITRTIMQDLPPDTASALDGITYGPFVCGAFLTNETGPMPWDDIYAIAVAGRSFNMFFNHANPVRDGARKPGGSLMVYAGGDRGRRIIDKTDDEIRDVFLKDLHELLPKTKGTIAETLIQRWPYAIPYTAPGRYKLQDALERPLGNVFLAGDYLDLPAMENAAATGREAGAKIRERLGE